MAKSKTHVDYAEIEVPLAMIPATKFGARFEMRLNSEQTYALRQVTQALHEQCAELDNGTPVNSIADTLEWLVEQVAKQADTID